MSIPENENDVHRLFGEYVREHGKELCPDHSLAIEFKFVKNGPFRIHSVERHQYETLASVEQSAYTYFKFRDSGRKLPGKNPCDCVVLYNTVSYIAVCFLHPEAKFQPVHFIDIKKWEGMVAFLLATKRHSIHENELIEWENFCIFV